MKESAISGQRMKLDTIIVSKQSQFGEQDCTYRIHPKKKKKVTDNPVNLHFLLKSEFKKKKKHLIV